MYILSHYIDYRGMQHYSGNVCLADLCCHYRVCLTKLGSCVVCVLLIINMLNLQASNNKTATNLTSPPIQGQDPSVLVLCQMKVSLLYLQVKQYCVQLSQYIIITITIISFVISVCSFFSILDMA